VITLKRNTVRDIPSALFNSNLKKKMKWIIAIALLAALAGAQRPVSYLFCFEIWKNNVNDKIEYIGT
jgi:hypothetical protein